MAESSGPWRKMQVRGLDNAMQWMGKDNARKKRRLERSVGVWNGGPRRLHQARGGITLIDEDTPRSGSACADTTTTNDARHSRNRQGLRARSRSVVFGL